MAWSAPAKNSGVIVSTSNVTSCIPLSSLSLHAFRLYKEYHRIYLYASKLLPKFFQASLDVSSGFTEYTLLVISKIVCKFHLQETVVDSYFPWYVPGITA